MAPSGETYRRLPGRRRGLWGGASMWMGSDHLLLVKSAWFREEYKRFYLRDIQAIVVAPCARFYVSTPVLIMALFWLLAGLGNAFWPASFAIVWGAGTLALLATWISVSIASSCRCRLYTAVSRDNLPSLYRTWTARKFLDQVKPWIDQVQGVVDAGWVEAERSNAGPDVATLPPAQARGPAAGTAARSHSLASDLFVLSLFVGSLVDFSTVHSGAAAWYRVNTGLTLAQMVGAVAVMIQYSRGRLQRAMQKVAIAALVSIGVMFYVQSVSFSIGNAVRQISSKPALMPTLSPVVVVHQISDGLGLLLGFLGAAIILRGNRADIIED